MLILTRHPADAIRIGDDTVITIIAIQDNKIRCGFQAPAEIAVNREEIWLRIQQQSATQGEL